MISHLSIHSTKKIFARETPHVSAMSRAKIAPAAARSDAVRGCSLGALSPREDLGASTAAAASTATAAQQLATSAATGGRSAFAPLAVANPGPCHRAPFVSRCTPARWVAVKMDCHWPTPFGPGGLVLTRTNAEPRQNHQHIEIAGYFRPVLRFSGFALASCAYAYVRVDARVYARQKYRTTEPHVIILYDHRFNGSGLVLTWFSPEPARRCDLKPTENRQFRNKIGGGNTISLHASPSDLRIRGQKEGRGRETFGAGIPAGRRGGWVGGADRDQARRVGKNGGFLRVCAGRSGRVGTAMLEQVGEGRGNPWVVEPRRKLCRLNSGAARVALVGGAGADRLAQPEGGAPPSPRRPVPSPLADAIFLISAQSRFHACHAGKPEARQVRRGDTGPGDRASLAVRSAAPGRGVSADWGLRRSGQGNGGGAHVN
jgi:hypothetical protein